MCVDLGETFSSNFLHLMSEADSSLSGHAIKIRKPYIITKQRERWTEEEHNKFLEALKQYGRAWRRIEEHIGSKTTVQIRSHAQKFFSKVVRETSNNKAGNMKCIEIPPPRPKRKPSHPYPRKLGHLSCKKGSFVDEHLWSFISKQSASEHESKSPTSVLTTFDSDVMGATAFDLSKPCTAPVLFAVPSDQGSPSKFSSNSTVYRDNQSTDSDTYAMELDLHIQDPAPVTTQKTTSLKLFGRTFIVSGSQLHDNELEHQESLSDCKKIDSRCQKLQEQDKNLISPVEPNTVSLPSWWALYEGRPCMTSHRIVNSDDSSTSSCSNSGYADKSCSEVVTQMEESLMQSSLLKPNRNAVFSSNFAKGFVPYRRCD